jgi:hypothetical protein
MNINPTPISGNFSIEKAVVPTGAVQYPKTVTGNHQSMQTAKENRLPFKYFAIALMICIFRATHLAR